MQFCDVMPRVRQIIVLPTGGAAMRPDAVTYQSTSVGLRCDTTHNTTEVRNRTYNQSIAKLIGLTDN